MKEKSQKLEFLKMFFPQYKAENSLDDAKSYAMKKNHYELKTVARFSVILSV